MKASDMLKALAILNADLAAAIMKAEKAGLDQAEIQVALEKAAQLVGEADGI